MATIYSLIGFSQYIIKDKILYRKSYKTFSKSCKWQYREERKINIIENKGVKGYKLIKDNDKKLKFHPLTKLKHRLKKCT